MQLDVLSSELLSELELVVSEQTLFFRRDGDFDRLFDFLTTNKRDTEFPNFAAPFDVFGLSEARSPIFSLPIDRPDFNEFADDPDETINGTDSELASESCELAEMLRRQLSLFERFLSEYFELLALGSPFSMLSADFRKSLLTYLPALFGIFMTAVASLLFGTGGLPRVSGELGCFSELVGLARASVAVTGDCETLAFLDFSPLLLDDCPVLIFAP